MFDGLPTQLFTPGLANPKFASPPELEVELDPNWKREFQVAAYYLLNGTGRGLLDLGRNKNNAKAVGGSTGALMASGPAMGLGAINQYVSVGTEGFPTGVGAICLRVAANSAITTSNAVDLFYSSQALHVNDFGINVWDGVLSGSFFNSGSTLEGYANYSVTGWGAGTEHDVIYTWSISSSVLYVDGGQVASAGGIPDLVWQSTAAIGADPYYAQSGPTFLSKRVSRVVVLRQFVTPDMAAELSARPFAGLRARQAPRVFLFSTVVPVHLSAAGSAAAHGSGAAAPAVRLGASGAAAMSGRALAAPVVRLAAAGSAASRALAGVSAIALLAGAGQAVASGQAMAARTQRPTLTVPAARTFRPPRRPRSLLP